MLLGNGWDDNTYKLNEAVLNVLRSEVFITDCDLNVHVHKHRNSLYPNGHMGVELTGKRPVMGNLNVFFKVSAKKLINKLTLCRWCDTIALM